MKLIKKNTVFIFNKEFKSTFLFKSMSNYCKVKNCRFKYNHITSGHQCEKCLKYGHGIHECGSFDKICLLQDLSKNDELKKNNFCKIIGCKFYWTHNTDRHSCSICGSNHSILNCPDLNSKICEINENSFNELYYDFFITEKDINEDIMNKIKYFFNKNKLTYTYTKYLYNNKNIYFRKKKLKDRIDIFFINSDDEEIYLKKFTENYKFKILYRASNP